MLNAPSTRSSSFRTTTAPATDSDSATLSGSSTSVASEIKAGVMRMELKDFLNFNKGESRITPTVPVAAPKPQTTTFYSQFINGLDNMMLSLFGNPKS